MGSKAVHFMVTRKQSAEERFWGRQTLQRHSHDPAPNIALSVGIGGLIHSLGRHPTVPSPPRETVNPVELAVRVRWHNARVVQSYPGQL